MSPVYPKLPWSWASMPDVNRDGKVDILDIATVAKAYGTEPGHERWDPISDLNNDGKVDILDIATVAKDYGKTA